jgi:phosphoglycolate phosphatase
MHATNHVLVRAGRRPVSFEEIRTMVGHGARKLIERGFAATGAPLSDKSIKSVYADFLDYYAAHIAEESRLFPGAARLLDRCVSEGLKLAVCTNKFEALSVKLIGALGLAHYFSAIVGPDTLRIGKPDPAPYREAVRRCGAEVHRSIMIGDSETDVLTARAAGVPVIAVTFGYTERYVAEYSPDHLADDFDAVWPILQGYRA